MSLQPTTTVIGQSSCTGAFPASSPSAATFQADWKREDQPDVPNLIGNLSCNGKVAEECSTYRAQS